MKRLIPDDADGQPSLDCVGKVKFELKSGHAQPIGDKDVPKVISCARKEEPKEKKAPSDNEAPIIYYNAANQLSIEFSTIMVAILSIIMGIISFYIFF